MTCQYRYTVLIGLWFTLYEIGYTNVCYSVGWRDIRRNFSSLVGPTGLSGFFLVGWLLGYFEPLVRVLGTGCSWCCLFDTFTMPDIFANQQTNNHIHYNVFYACAVLIIAKIAWTPSPLYSLSSRSLKKMESLMAHDGWMPLVLLLVHLSYQPLLSL